MRSILRSILSGFGARTIFEAADGADGLEVVLDRNPDFILCDWVMQPLNGTDFLRTLRAERDPELNTLPVIIVTAHAQRSVIVEALRIGVHGFIAKPVSPAILYRHVADVLTKQAEFGRSRGISFGADFVRRRDKPASKALGVPGRETAAQEAEEALAFI